jgi:carbamate kinase
LKSRNTQGPLVIAFGGNALLPDPRYPETQSARATDFAQAIAPLLPRPEGVVLVHGNGPQVGMILLRVEETENLFPRTPLDELVAETQGSIGYLLSRAMGNAFSSLGIDVQTSTIVSKVLVDNNDPKLKISTKPIGPYYTEEESIRLVKIKHWDMVQVDSERWRRVVPSPVPVEVLEMDSILDALERGKIVIAGGGGGIPVTYNESGELVGVEAVIDKDLTATLLACSLSASAFILLTGVPHVMKDFGSPEAQPLHRISIAETQELIKQNQFPEGSMLPKIQAAVKYVQSTGHHAIITDTDHLTEAMQQKAGTWIMP